MEDKILENRWRLILGKDADDKMNLNNESLEMESVLDFLYSREEMGDGGLGSGGDKSAGLGNSSLSIPEWIKKVRKLFPKESSEIIEKHALEKYNLKELLNDKEVLEKLHPNKELLKLILTMKNSMNSNVVQTAKKIVKKIVRELEEKLKKEVKQCFTGKIDKNSFNGAKSIRNFNFKRSVAKNLKNYNKDLNNIIFEKLYFNKNVRKYNKWDIIIAIDESGSMMDSVIHSAIMAGIFSSLSNLRTKLIIFDTEVVDLTKYVSDPVETLMSVQLGGGTDITKALNYVYQEINEGKKTIVVLVTDLYEGGARENMYKSAARIIETGAKLLTLTSLDKSATPFYDKKAAEKFSEMGASVAALTPKELSLWVSKVIS